MISTLGGKLQEVLELLSSARAALDARDPRLALGRLERFEDAFAALRGLAVRGEPLMRFLLAGIRREQAGQEQGAGQGPALSLHVAADKLVLAFHQTAAFESRARRLKAAALEMAAAQALEQGGQEGRALWGEAVRRSPLSPALLELQGRFGLAWPPGVPGLSAGPLDRQSFDPGLSSILPWKGGMLAATRHRNAQGHYVDARIEWIGPDGSREPVPMERAIDLRPLPGGVNPYLSMAAHPDGERVVFPEFVSDQAVSLSCLHVGSGRVRRFGEAAVPAVEYPFNVVSSGERVWRVCVFSGRIEEFDAGGAVAAGLLGASAVPGAHAVLPLADGSRLLACSTGKVRRKYGRFLGCSPGKDSWLWRWDPAAGSASALPSPAGLPRSPRYVFAWGGNLVFCCDDTVEVFDRGMEHVLSLDLREHVLAALGPEGGAAALDSLLCCMDGPTLSFAAASVVSCLGSVTFEPENNG